MLLAKCEAGTRTVYTKDAGGKGAQFSAETLFFLGEIVYNNEIGFHR